MQIRICLLYFVTNLWILTVHRLIIKDRKNTLNNKLCQKLLDQQTIHRQCKYPTPNYTYRKYYIATMPIAKVLNPWVYEQMLLVDFQDESHLLWFRLWKSYFRECYLLVLENCIEIYICEQPSRLRILIYCFLHLYCS